MRQRPILRVSVACLIVAFLTILLPRVSLCCGGALYEDSGQISSDGSTDCEWTIVGEDEDAFHAGDERTNEQPNLEITSIDIEGSAGNWEEHTTSSLDIYDGVSEDDRLIGRYCGGRPPAPIISRSGALFLQLSTFSGSSLKGFSASYTMVDERTLGCGALNGSSGQFQSPDVDGDGNYENNMLCDWIIIVGANKRIRLSIDRMDIEPGDCRNDFLAVYDGDCETTPLIGKYCGDDPPAPIISSLNVLFVRFNSDYLSVFRGFEASYTEMDSDGGWGHWGKWGVCSQTCGQGTRMRTRDCVSLASVDGVADCRGDSQELGECSCQECTDEKGPVSECEEAFNQGKDLCGNNGRCINSKRGYKCKCCKGYKRSKKTGQCEAKPSANKRISCCGDCQHFECSFKGKVCAKDGTEYDSVFAMVLDRCQKGYSPKKELDIKNYGSCVEPVSKWGPWGQCSVTCGKGSKMRTRNATRPLTNKEKRKVPMTKKADCNTPPCPGCPFCEETCQVAEVCEVTDGGAECMCPSCKNDESDKVCGRLAGRSTKTYKSLCVLKRTACKLGEGFQLIHEGPCQACMAVTKHGYITTVHNGQIYNSTEAVDYKTCEGECDGGYHCRPGVTEEVDVEFGWVDGTTNTKPVPFPTSCCCS